MNQLTKAQLRVFKQWFDRYGLTDNLVRNAPAWMSREIKGIAQRAYQRGLRENSRLKVYYWDSILIRPTLTVTAKSRIEAQAILKKYLKEWKNFDYLVRLEDVREIDTTDHIVLRL